MKKVIYIWLVKLVSRWKRVKDPQAIVYLMSFAGNEHLIKAFADLAKQLGRNFTVLYLPQCKAAAAKLAAEGIQTIEFTDGLDFVFHKLQLVMQARLLLCDNYYAFLSGCAFDHQQTNVVQLWHANGAIKTFGWEKLTTAQRSAADKRRFQKVYDQFDEYLVGSKKMAQVFAQSYHVPQTRMNVIGYPRTDELFDKSWQMQVSQNIKHKYPDIVGKEIILYTPTYREDDTGKPVMNLPEDFDQFADQLSGNQRMIIKLHPHVKAVEKQLKRQLDSDKVIWVDDFSTNDLLLVADRLITDYSSVIFDYSLLPNAKQILFYCYDYDQYAQRVGIQADFKSWIPGKMVTTTSDLIKEVQQPLEATDFTQFNQLWNTANDGHATERVLQTELKYIQK